MTELRNRESLSRWEQAGIFLAFMLAVCTTILLTGQSFLGFGNSYNSYTLQAMAWLQGRLDLGCDYSWLELAIVDGKYYVSFPPFPSVIMLPLAMIFGTRTPDTLVALVAAALSCIHAIRLCAIMLPDRRRTAYWTLFLLLCNGYLFLCLNGWVWFIAQNLCFCLSLASMHHAVKGRGGLSLACWAMAVGCRPMTGLALPLLLYLLWQQLRDQHPEEPLLKLAVQRLHWLIAPALIGIFYMALNWARFGNPLEFGHNYLPEFNKYGAQFSFSYILKNLGTLMRLPDLENGRIEFQTVEGGTAWLLNPILWVGLVAWISALRARRGGMTRWLIPVTVVLYLLIILMHRTLGGWQFGNRYLVDLAPWIFYGILCHQPENDSVYRFSLPLAAVAGVCQITWTIAAYNGWQ